VCEPTTVIHSFKYSCDIDIVTFHIFVQWYTDVMSCWADSLCHVYDVPRRNYH